MKKRDPSWYPSQYDKPDIFAIKAVADGTASEDQQKRAIAWLINKAAMTYDVSFRSDADGGDRETAFAEGRRFVGLEIVKMINMPHSIAAKIGTKDA